MSKRTKVISFIAIILAIIIIFGVGIGVKKGWFAGLADVINVYQQTFTVTVKVAEGTPPNLVPLSAGAEVFATQDDQYKTGIGFSNSDSCTSKNKPFSAGGGVSKGTTSLNPERTSNSLVITVEIQQGISDYYIRLESSGKKAQSCDFNVYMPNNGAEAIADSQVWKITNPMVSGGYTAIFLYSGSGGTEPQDKGAILGVLKTADDQPITNFGDRNIILIKNNNLVSRTSPHSETGSFTFTDLEVGEYTVKAGWACHYEEVEKLAAVIAGSTSNIGTLTLGVAGPPEGQGKINFTVTNSSDQNKPLPGVQIRLSALGKETKIETTDANGQYSFCPVVPATWNALLTKDGFEPLSVGNLVVSSGSTIDKIVSMEVEKIEEVFAIVGRTVNTNDEAVLDATVTLRDQETDGVINNPDGQMLVTTTKSSVRWNDGVTIRVFLNSFLLERVPIPAVEKAYYLEITASGYQAGYMDIESASFPVGGLIDVGKIVLYRSSDYASISGRVTNNGQALQGAKVKLEGQFDDKTFSLGTTDSSGNYSNSQVPATFIGQTVKVCAEYEKDNIPYAACHLKSGKEEFTLEQTNANINIDFTGKIHENINFKVHVIDEAGVGIPNADVSFAEVYSSENEQKVEERGKKNTGPNAEIVEFSYKDFELKSDSLYGFVVSAGDVYKGYVTEDLYRAGDIPEQVTIVLKRTNPLIVDYYFFFYQKPKQANYSGTLQKIIDIITFREKKSGILFDFSKVNLGLLGDVPFDKTQWDIGWQYRLPDALVGKMSPSNYPTDSRFLPGGVNPSNVYRISVTFPDQETKDQWAKRFFTYNDARNITFNIIPHGMQGWVRYLPARIEQKDVEAYGDQAYKIKVVNIFDPVNQEISEAVIATVDDAVKANEAGEDSDIESNDQIINRDIDIRIKKDSGTGESGSSAEASSSAIYKTVKAINGIVMFNIEPGNYTALASTGIYKIAERNNQFSVKSGDKIVNLNLEMCYASTAKKINYQTQWGVDSIELGRTDLFASRVLYFGALRAKPVIDVAKKGGLSAIAYLGDMQSGSFYAKSGFKYCVDNNDENYSGGVVGLTSSRLKEVKTSNETASIISYEAGNIIYDNVLNDTNRSSFGRIAAAINALPTASADNIYNLITETSSVQRLEPEIRDSVASSSDQLYVATLTAYKMNGILLRQKIDHLRTPQEQNIAKALVRHVYETAGANSGDGNIYEPVRPISSTILTTSLITSGDWLKVRYQNLSVQRKINYQYRVLLSWISGNRTTRFINNQIAAFNSWIDRIMGRQDTGKITGKVIRRNSQGVDQEVQDVLVTIGSKVGRTDKNGEFVINRVAIGRHNIDTKDRETSATLELVNPTQQVKINKNQISNINIRLSQQ